MNTKKVLAQTIKVGAEKMSGVSTNFSSLWFFHQPKCPKQLIKQNSPKA